MLFSSVLYSVVMPSLILAAPTVPTDLGKKTSVDIPRTHRIRVWYSSFFFGYGNSTYPPSKLPPPETMGSTKTKNNESHPSTENRSLGNLVMAVQRTLTPTQKKTVRRPPHPHKWDLYPYHFQTNQEILAWEWD